MRTLITGAGGFAGQHLLRQQLTAGRSPITGATLDGRAPSAGTLTPEEAARAEWVALDVTVDESVNAALAGCQPERVFHLAGQASVGQSFSRPLQTWAVNATGTLRLAVALPREVKGRAVRLLVVSSAEVYGSVPDSGQPIAEEAPLRPTTPYGASKAAAELAGLQSAAGGAVEVVVARSFNHVGPGQDARFVLPSMARQLALIRRGEREPVLQVGNLDVWRDFLDVRDVAAAYACLMDHGASGQVYNVCSGRAVSLREVVEELVRLSGTGARIEVDPQRVRPVDIPRLRGDATRLEALGWKPRFSLQETLRDLLRAAGAC